MTIINGLHMDSLIGVFTRSSAQFKDCHFRHNTKAIVIIRDRVRADYLVFWMNESRNPQNICLRERRRCAVDLVWDYYMLEQTLEVMRPCDEDC
jgi:hypothetical protein